MTYKNYCKFSFDPLNYKVGSNFLFYQQLSSINVVDNNGKNYAYPKIYHFIDELTQQLDFDLEKNISQILMALKSYFLYKYNKEQQLSIFIEEPVQTSFDFQFSTMIIKYIEVQETSDFIDIGENRNKISVPLLDIVNMFNQLLIKHSLENTLQLDFHFLSTFEQYVIDYYSIKKNNVKNNYKKNELAAYYNISKILDYDIHIIQKSFLHGIKKYKIEISHIIQKYNDKNRKIKSFYPAGLCYYSDKILLNTNLYPYRAQYTRHHTIKEIHNVFWHEIGHAIHYLHNSLILKKSFYLQNYNSLYSKSLIDHSIFIKEIRKNYAYSKINGVFKDKYLDYYTKPGFNKKTKKIDWTTTSKEGFAESFSIIMNLFIHGLGISNSYAIQNRTSGTRIFTKSFTPTMRFMLKNLDWIKIGVPQRLYYKRLPLIKLFLDKVDTLPIHYKQGQVKYTKQRRTKMYPVNIKQLKIK